jgi:hypothetical protein
LLGATVPSAPRADAGTNSGSASRPAAVRLRPRKLRLLIGEGPARDADEVFTE